ncbi:hypothetical protein EVAR_86084_1 [Eumeta japonica]|uniref:Uncharacterized protein n=1 Tax=Eumeta variegata TaxID=151549 RepID=A0A4C1V1T7_EUMVA|nr:hypothetical protein EVAR_86084_1 [Eumeta japonica]
MACTSFSRRCGEKKFWSTPVGARTSLEFRSDRSIKNIDYISFALTVQKKYKEETLTTENILQIPRGHVHDLSNTRRAPDDLFFKITSLSAPVVYDRNYRLLAIAYTCLSVRV